MIRAVDVCEFRSILRRATWRERAACALVEALFPGIPGPRPIPRATCERCCRSRPPGPGSLNDVVASVVYRQACRILDGPGRGAAHAEVAGRAMAEATPALEVVRREPNHPRWSGPVPELGEIADLLDPSVTPDTFADHLRRREPFAYVRYNDGEWYSILGELGRNGDGHDFHHDTLGRELGESLAYASRLGRLGTRYYVGLHDIGMRDAIRRYLAERGLAYGPRWVSDNLFGLGLLNFSTLRFLGAVRDFAGPKVLVGNADLAPAARGLGARHVVIPKVDCHRDYGRILRECRASRPALLIGCASMTTKVLVARLHRENPSGSFADCGHIFDALVGNYTREYTQGDWGGIRAFLAEHYAPVVLGPGRGGGAG